MTRTQISAAQSSQSPARYVRDHAAAGPVEVRPVETGADWMEPAPVVGLARTWTEAQRLLHAAGYRVMHTGGLLQADWDHLGERATVLNVTVYPRD